MNPATEEGEGRLWNRGNREEEWVKRARKGDREAFGHLVRLHRARAFGWVASMTKDPHLAEDIVQEAWIRAFLKMGSLLDEERFLPWFRAIVANETRMKMRRGGPFGKERPLSPLTGEERESVDRESVVTAGNEWDPEWILLRRETTATIRRWVQCLSPKERRLFEAHFFEELSPKELAERFSIPRGQVYTSLHRAKEKIRREGVRGVLAPYLHHRKESKNMTERRLEPPPVEGSWTSLGAAIVGAHRYMKGRKYSLCDVMGYTGLAFRINIDPKRVDVAGPTSFPWKSVMSRGLSHLGITIAYLGPEDASYEPSTPERVTEAIRLIHRSVDQGVPVVAWDLFIPEFGLVYGYDDDRQELAAVDPSKRGTLPYDRLGRGELKELALMVLEKKTDPPLRRMLHQALQGIVDHARGRETPIPGFVHGLAGYDAWIEGLQSGNADPFGLAYNAAVISDARIQAARFLLQWSTTCTEQQSSSNDRKQAARAAASYAQVAEALVQLQERFPFPAGGDPRDPDEIREGVAALKRAKQAEREGVEHLEAWLDNWTDHEFDAPSMEATS